MLKRSTSASGQRQSPHRRKSTPAFILGTLVLLLGLTGCVPTDVRQVNWPSANYSVSCPGGSGVQATLRNGFAHVPGSPSPPYFRDGWDVRLVSTSVGDIAGDGTHEAVVRLTCYVVGSANGISQDVQVLTAGPKLIHRVSLYNRYGSPYYQPWVSSVAISGGKIVGTASYWTPTDCHACASHHESFIVAFDRLLHRWIEE